MLSLSEWVSKWLFSDLQYSVSTVGTFSTVGTVSAAGAAGAVSAVSAVSTVIDLFVLIYWGMNYDFSMGRGYKYCSCG